jgi:parvulin-like peptidyl-prolyl isomerase
MRLETILKEPLLHFLLIGGVLFAFVAWSGARSGTDRAGIAVTSAQIELLAANYAKAWGRSPTEGELRGLIEDRVQEEIAVREAMVAGLDRDDTIIRRRLRQKFEVMAEEQDAHEVPTEADLSAYLATHADRFAQPATISFDQVALDVDGTAVDGERAAARAKIAIRDGADPAKLGRASMLPGRVDNSRLDLVAREFGTTFAESLSKLPTNEWSGPVRSAFGAHLVRVTAYVPGALPPLERVRVAVAREWENERRAAARTESYRKLREHYHVVIEAAQPPLIAAR